MKAGLAALALAVPSASFSPFGIGAGRGCRRNSRECEFAFERGAAEGHGVEPRGTAGNTVSGFPLVHLTLYGHALGRHFDISASVYNLFNQKYFGPGRPEDPEDKIQRTDGIFG